MALQAMDGFSAFTEGGHHWIVRSDLAAALRPLMARPFAELGSTPAARPMAGGRAGPVAIGSPRPDEELLIRPYARGGWLGALMRRTRVEASRPLRELAVTARAKRDGLPVPEPLGITADARFRGWWTFEFWTVLLPGTRQVATVWREGGPPLVDALGAALRRCMDGGLRHADLNARNLIASREGGTWRVWVVDLDRAVLGEPLDDAQRLAQLKRLYRSLAKEGAFPSAAGDTAYAPLVNAVLAHPLGDVAQSRFLASCRRAVFWHSLLWRKKAG